MTYVQPWPVLIAHSTGDHVRFGQIVLFLDDVVFSFLDPALPNSVDTPSEESYIFDYFHALEKACGHETDV